MAYFALLPYTIYFLAKFLYFVTVHDDNTENVNVQYATFIKSFCFMVHEGKANLFVSLFI